MLVIPRLTVDWDTLLADVLRERMEGLYRRLEAATRAGITVVNAPTGNTIAAAEAAQAGE